MGFPAGAFLGNAVINLIPEVFQSVYKLPKFERKGATFKFSLCVILGIIVFTSVEKIIRHFGFGHSHAPNEDDDHVHKQEKTIELSKITLTKNKRRKRKRTSKKKYQKLVNESDSNLIKKKNGDKIAQIELELVALSKKQLKNKKIKT